MKSIATVNFKGGVGKTTVSWILAKYTAEKKDKKVLVVDTDAQMSLTLAVQLEESGLLVRDFEEWYDTTHKDKGKTLLNGLEKYDSYARGTDKHFDFSVGYSLIYKMSDNLHFIPSTVDLYWLELDVFDKAATKDFMRALLGKIEHSSVLPKYDYVFFDCPPNFTALSYSVLSCANLILVPINPDVFAARGIELMIDGLQLRIQPWPNPRIGVFMNKAKFYKGDLTRETSRYWEDSKSVCDKKRSSGVEIVPFETYIPDRVHIKRAIPGRYFPSEFEEEFGKLWKNIEDLIR